MPAAFNPAATVASAEPQAAAMRDGVIAQNPEAFAASETQAIARMALTPAAREQVLSWALASDRSVMARAAYEDMITDLRPRLAAMKTPVEVIYPYDASMGAPAAMVDGVYAGAYAALPGVKLKRIDGGYHFIMLDQPEAFAAEVESFLR
jgi:pimeloyl-ACP methyl ester carboxylesterase